MLQDKTTAFQAEPPASGSAIAGLTTLREHSREIVCPPTQPALPADLCYPSR
jgi:hypothetical protein